MENLKSNEFRKDLVKGYDVEQKGNTLYIKGAYFLPQEIDYSDQDSIKILATNAVHTANGFYDLIKTNCDIQNPEISSKAHLEMYLALAGLACEIYMKSIIYNENLHNSKKMKGHKLDELFSMLPIDVQNNLKTQFSNIGTILPSVGDLFMTLRYDFELNQIQGDYFIIFDLMEALSNISNSYPKKTTGSIRAANGILCLE